MPKNMTSIPQTEIQIAQKKLDGPKPTKKNNNIEMYRYNFTNAM